MHRCSVNFVRFGVISCLVWTVHGGIVSVATTQANSTRKQDSLLLGYKKRTQDTHRTLETVDGFDRRSSPSWLHPYGASIVTGTEEGISASLRGKVFFDEALMADENFAFNTIAMSPHTRMPIVNDYQEVFLPGKHHFQLPGPMDIIHGHGQQPLATASHLNAHLLHSPIGLLPRSGQLKALESNSIAHMEPPPGHNAFLIDDWTRTPVALHLNPKWVGKMAVDNSLMDDFMGKLQRGEVDLNNLKSLEVKPEASERSVSSAPPHMATQDLADLQRSGTLPSPNGFEGKDPMKYDNGFRQNDAASKARVGRQRFSAPPRNIATPKMVPIDRPVTRPVSFSFHLQDNRPSADVKDSPAYVRPQYIYNDFVQKQLASDYSVSQSHLSPHLSQHAPSTFLFENFFSSTANGDPFGVKHKPQEARYQRASSFIPSSAAYHIRQFQPRPSLANGHDFNQPQTPPPKTSYSLSQDEAKQTFQPPPTRKPLTFDSGLAHSENPSTSVDPTGFHPAPREHLSPDVVVQQQQQQQQQQQVTPHDTQSFNASPDTAEHATAEPKGEEPAHKRTQPERRKRMWRRTPLNDN